ncbi:hypothetical protein [Morganella morganii]|uniref:hypothetical protein n=1 Tax=Morganella morganii TaxID=582 RepID=UPI00339C60B2
MRCLFFVVFVCSFFISKFSFALECYAVVNDSEITTETVSVDDIIIPESAEDESIIWRSEEYSRTVKCNKAGVDEHVYFYPFPNIKPESLPKGMIFGLIYNGTSYDLTTSGMKIQTDILVPKNGEKYGNINVQVYIKKNGSISGGYDGELPIYQLDGVGGLNNSPNAKNYRFHLSNLSNIATGNCSYTLNGIQSTTPVSVNDNLISNGQTINSVGSVSVTCTPQDRLKNRTAKMDLYTTSASGGDFFSTDKDGLSYQLIMNGSTITPSSIFSSPLSVSFKLDNNAKSSLNVDQKVYLLSADKDWLYQNSEITATSKNPDLKMKVNSFQ